MIVTILLCLLLSVQPATAMELVSLQPEAARPGAPVILSTSGSPDSIELLFGEIPVAAQRLAPGIFQFQVPDLPPGEYTVRTRPATPDEAATPLWFQVLAIPPVITGLSPDTFSFCRGTGPEELSVMGTGFEPAASVLLDGSTIPISSRSPGHLSLQLPPLPVGLHKIQIANPDGQSSLPATLSVVRQPVIQQIDSGGNAVTSYQLTIRGENFSPHSQLLLNGAPLPGRSSDIQTGDRVSYVDCTTLTYLRHPTTGQLQTLEFKVVNPDGQVSNSYSVSGY